MDHLGFSGSLNHDHSSTMSLNDIGESKGAIPKQNTRNNGQNQHSKQSTVLTGLERINMNKPIIEQHDEDALRRKIVTFSLYRHFISSQ